MARPKKNPQSHEYLPALVFDVLTPLYDPVARLTTRETTYKNLLLEQARIRNGQRVLDVGCGTGTLLLRARELLDFEAIGLDGDFKILSIAREKASKRAAGLRLVGSFSFRMPFPAESFDRVLSSLMLHHLAREVRVRTLSDAFRVLRPGGGLHVVDWGRPTSLIMKALSWPVRLADGKDRTEDNFTGRLPELFRQAGFEEVEETSRLNTLFGTLSLYRARKPRS